jgi:hypothetical protein
VASITSAIPEVVPELKKFRSVMPSVYKSVLAMSICGWLGAVPVAVMVAVFVEGSISTLKITCPPSRAAANNPKINPRSAWCFIGRVRISA